MSEYSGDPTERRYNLKVKLKFFHKTIHENTGKGLVTYNRKLCLLVPQESDERTRFLMAWLPDTPGEHYELGAFMSYPVDSPCRLSIHRADERCDRHYLFVMSKGVEDILVRRNEGDVFSLEVLKASEDEAMDNAKDTDLDIELQQ